MLQNRLKMPYNNPASTCLLAFCLCSKVLLWNTLEMWMAAEQQRRLGKTLLNYILGIAAEALLHTTDESRNTNWASQNVMQAVHQGRFPSDGTIAK
jgi:hypothetical protein